MEITTFTLSDPDRDGDMRAALSATLDNRSDRDVRLARVSTVFLTSDGFAFVSNRSDESLRVEPGESFSFEPDTPWINEEFCGRARDDVTVRLAVTLFAREFIRLGEIDVPADHKAPARLVKAVGSASIGDEVRVLVSRTRPDGDGDLQLRLRCGVHNPGSAPLEPVVLRCELVDEDDAVARSDDNSVAVAPGATELLEINLWGLKSRDLRSARVRLSISVFHPVQSETAEAVSSPRD